MNKIVIVDDFFTVEECERAIELFRRIGPSKIGSYESTITEDSNEILNIDTINEMNEYKDKLFDAAKTYCDETIIYGWSEIVKWKTNAWQDSHTDIAHPDTIFTAISYLNDNYTGGETFIEDMNVTPKQGRVAFFYGMHYAHGVRSIREGTRYTIPSWYNKPNQPVYIEGMKL